MAAMKPRPANPSSDDSQSRLAVLIDADNAQPSVIAGLLAEVAKFGVASVKRIYGDFTSTQQTQWKKALLKHSISPVQQFAYTVGKNATDASLIIDAMDLMYTGRFDGFALVSSDSDFTRQAIEEASDDSGWAKLGGVGNYLNKIRPDFDPRLYGHKKLSDLFKHTPSQFAVEERAAPGGSSKTVYVRALR
jgi:uncharacterized LabA/DUF88 family protein